MGALCVFFFVANDVALHVTGHSSGYVCGCESVARQLGIVVVGEFRCEACGSFLEVRIVYAALPVSDETIVISRERLYLTWWEQRDDLDSSRLGNTSQSPKFSHFAWVAVTLDGEGAVGGRVNAVPQTKFGVMRELRVRTDRLAQDSNRWALPLHMVMILLLWSISVCVIASRTSDIPL